MIPNHLLSAALLLILCAIPIAYSQCEQTNTYDLPGSISPGTQDLTLTFGVIATKIPQISPRQTKISLTTYQISNISVTFFYKQDEQSISVFEKTISVVGGPVQATIFFNWSKKTLTSTTQGNAKAVISTNKLLYTKVIKITSQFMQEELQEVKEVAFVDSAVITESSKTLTDTEKTIFTDFLNKDSGSSSVVSEIFKAIKENYEPILTSFILQEKQSIINDFSYSWIVSNEPITIDYSMNITDLSVGEGTMKLLMRTQIKNDEEWDCQISTPTEPYEIEKYGTNQQILSLDIFKNTLRFGISKGVFNTKLNKQLWGSRAFQFYAGDLYDIISKIKDTFIARQPVSGSCVASKDKVNISISGESSLDASLEHICQVEIRNTKIMDLTIVTSYSVQVTPISNHLSLKLSKYDLASISVSPSQDFTVMNLHLLKHLVSNSLTNLNNIEVFGTNWKTFNRNEPVFKFIDDKYAFIYEAYTPGITDQ